MAENDEVAARRLRMIADILGVSVEQFFNAAMPQEFADLNECVRLWSALRTDEGRASVLDHLRRTLAEEAA